MPSKKTLLFDFDGTLADTLRPILTISNRLSDMYGYKKVGEEDIERFRKKKTREAIRELEIPVLLLPSIVAHVKRELQKEIHLIRPVHNMQDVLQQLSHRYQLGILTSNSAQNVSLFIRHNHLPPFEIIYTGSSIFGKSRLLQKIMLKHRIAPDDLIYVGDETRDIEAARKTGISMIAVSWGINTAETLAKLQPTYLIHHPQEMLPLLLQEEAEN